MMGLELVLGKENLHFPVAHHLCKPLERIEDSVVPIELVDGENMAEMFEKLELGLKPIKTYTVDEKFFEEFKL